MDHFVITVRPASTDEALLQVSDAMQQVIDALKLFEAAERAEGSPHEAFDWRLESASTSSPFTVVAIAQSKNPAVPITAHIERVKTEVSTGLRGLIERGVPPPWMGQEEMKAVQSLLVRHQNGIGRTDIDFEGGNVVSIDRLRAEYGLRALMALNAIDVAADLIERQAFGEIEGIMVAAGRYKRQPAIQIKSELYGFVWCTLSPTLTNRFGSEHSMADVWEGRTVGVQGRINYAAGGRIGHVQAVDIREIEEAPLIDLDSILDPDFTAGMDPQEYLRRLHDGELA